MKKFLLMMILALLGGVTQVKADGEMFLRSNLKDGSWDSNLAKYQFNKFWDGTQDVYTLTIDNTMLTGVTDIWFRLYRNGTDYEVCPWHSGEEGGSYTYVFSKGQNETYDIKPISDNFKGTVYSFGIEHSKIKASQYTITVYLKYPDSGWEYYIKVDIDKVPVTISSYGNATFCSSRALDFTSAGITANIITAASDGNLTTSSLTKTPANTGLYLEGVAGTVNVPVIAFDNAEDATGNMLVGVTEETHIAQIDGANSNYILTVNKDGGNVDTPKFFKVNGTSGNTVKANKAYLQIPTASATRDYYWFNDFATAIDAVKQDQKMDGAVYNLAGQRVAQPGKGLYIVNGKKVIIK